MANETSFNLLRKANEIGDDKGNFLIVTLQEIVQRNGSKTEHVVISKVRRNVDGTQQGDSKSLFIPKGLAPSLIQTIDSLIG